MKKYLFFLSLFISSLAFSQTIQRTGGSNTSLTSGFSGVLPIANGGTNATSLSNLSLGSSTATTQSAGDNTTSLATDAFVTTAVNNAIAAVNPAVAVQEATTAVLPNTPTYLNGVAGIGATLTTTVTNTPLVVDGQTMALNDRLLVKNQASTFQNGVYYLSTVPALGIAWILTRALDYDAPTDMNNTGTIPVLLGTSNASTSWAQSSQVTTVGTDAVTFAQFSYAPSTILTNGGALGTPSSGALTNCTSIPVAQATGLLPLANGGLNLDLTATGGTSKFVKQNTLGGTPTVTQPATTDLSDITTWTDYSGSSTVTGWTSTTVKQIRYAIIGKVFYLWFYITGTSNSTSTSFTLPNTSVNITSVVYYNSCGQSQDNGAYLTTPALVGIGANSSTVSVYKDQSGTAWTNTGTKYISGSFFFPIQ